MAIALWTPHVTVAAVIERDGRFLLVEESEMLNQPAGHWEPGETLVAACARETLEEAAHRFEPTALVGAYRWQPPASETTYLRFAFCGILHEQVDRPLDPDIERTVWLTAAEIRRARARHRSPLLSLCIEDYLAGRRYPLELITHVE